MNFSEKLIRLRKREGISQEELASYLEVSRQAVSRWEVGTDIPTMKNLLALSRLFDVPVHELVGGAQPADSLEAETTSHKKVTKPARYQLLTKVLGGALAAVVAAGLLAALYQNQLRPAPTDPAERTIVDIEDLDGERIEPDAVTWHTTSEGGN